MQTATYALFVNRPAKARPSASRQPLVRLASITPALSLRLGRLLLVASVMLQAAAGRAQQPAPVDFKAHFLRLCDMACKELDKPFTPFDERDRANVDPATHHAPFFEDSHAVRALAVAYDMTGKRAYLDTCRRWSDRMIAYQARMIPKDAYYLNYYRRPGDRKEQWFSSDAASVGMAVLATAVRSTDRAERERYLGSVKAFARLVADKYLKDGGITDGIWTPFDGPWWASTAICGELFLLLYEETGDEQCRKIGVDAAHWLLKTDFRDARPITMKERPSGIVFYDFGFYAVALKYLPANSPPRKTLLAQISEMLQWLDANQIGRGGKPAWAYSDDSHTDMTGLPLLMYSFARQLPEHRGLTAEADRELRYVDGLILGKGELPLSQLNVWELVSWGMLSYAEKLSPGTLFRGSR